MALETDASCGQDGGAYESKVKSFVGMTIRYSNVCSPLTDWGKCVALLVSLQHNLRFPTHRSNVAIAHSCFTRKKSRIQAVQQMK